MPQRIVHLDNGQIITPGDNRLHIILVKLFHLIIWFYEIAQKISYIFNNERRRINHGSKTLRHLR